MVQSVAAYAGFEVEEIDWSVFSQKWAPGLERDGILVGVNWSGAHATGYDIPASELVANVEAHRRT
jgi:hypothetical protein